MLETKKTKNNFSTFFNFVWFILRLIQYRALDGGPKVTAEKAKERINICYNCENLNTAGFLVKLKGPRCKICGCFIHYKVDYKIEQCADTPVKWPMELK
jgi:hypothetical protein